MTELSVLNSILERLQDLTPETIEKFASSFGEVAKGESVIGTLHSQKTKALMVATRMIGTEYAMVEARIISEPDTEKVAELKRESERLEEIGRLVRKMFWAEAKEDLGAWGKCVGIRDGWLIVDRPCHSSASDRQKNGVDAFGEILRGMLSERLGKNVRVEQIDLLGPLPGLPEDTGDED